VYVILEVWAQIWKTIRINSLKIDGFGGGLGKFQLNNITLIFRRLMQMRIGCVLNNGDCVIL